MSDGPEPEEPTKSKPRHVRYLTRRRFLAATGTTAGIGSLAGCSTFDEQSNSPSTPVDGDETENETTAPPTDTDPEPEPLPEPPGEKRPIGEKYPELRVIRDEPSVGEAANRAVYTEYRTPIDAHYIVNHYETPVIDIDNWTITLAENGDSVEIAMRELRDTFPLETVTHTMQCSGNGRAYFEPEISGFSLSFGAVGTTEWAGAPLAAILEAYDVDTSPGRWLMVAGADGPEGEPVYARSIPIEKIVDDCILAYEMDGGPLPLEHGYPVRLLVPGWFGNNSVKWVEEMRVMETMLIGDEWRQYLNWQQNKYRILAAGQGADHNEFVPTVDTWEQIVDNVAGRAEYAPYMFDQVVKSMIASPADGETVSPTGGSVEIVGVAWAGDDRLRRVDVSTDGGETWDEAVFFGPDRGPSAWRQFRYDWNADPGEYTLISRATDEHDRTQPSRIGDPENGLAATEDDAYPWNQRGYGLNAYLPLSVTVSVQ